MISKEFENFFTRNSEPERVRPVHRIPELTWLVPMTFVSCK